MNTKKIRKNTQKLRKKRPEKNHAHGSSWKCCWHDSSGPDVPKPRVLGICVGKARTKRAKTQMRHQGKDTAVRSLRGGGSCLLCAGRSKIQYNEHQRQCPLHHSDTTNALRNKNFTSAQSLLLYEDTSPGSSKSPRSPNHLAGKF